MGRAACKIGAFPFGRPHAEGLRLSFTPRPPLYAI